VERGRPTAEFVHGPNSAERALSQSLASGWRRALRSRLATGDPLRGRLRRAGFHPPGSAIAFLRSRNTRVAACVGVFWCGSEDSSTFAAVLPSATSSHSLWFWRQVLARLLRRPTLAVATHLSVDRVVPRSVSDGETVPETSMLATGVMDPAASSPTRRAAAFTRLPPDATSSEATPRGRLPVRKSHS
jgi:hypothetical protein